MSTPIVSSPSLHADVYARALDARDPRFDGIFFVGITTTRIYCRPVCPSRLACGSHRRFFASAAVAERAGFRPCLRCRPELAPGRAVVDAVSRLAHAAARRIAAGALNGHSVMELAHELGVSERHLRRALERALGVSPVELAQTHRLLLAKRLLVDTTLSVTHVAYASGFQSLRRFNAAFLTQYRMPPSSLRRAPRPIRTDVKGNVKGEMKGDVKSDDLREATRLVTRSADSSAGYHASHTRLQTHPGTSLSGTSRTAPPDEYLRLTLAYRAPLAWDVLVACLAGDAIGGVEVVEGRRYGRTMCVDGRTGVIFAEDASGPSVQPARTRVRNVAHATHDTHATYVNVDVSSSLVPALMPLLARMRQLFDLDAEPTMIDAHLAQGGLTALVAERPGVRIPGAVDGFDIALRVLLRGRARIGRSDAVSHAGPSSNDPAARVAWELGEPLQTGIPALDRLAPSAARVAGANSAQLIALGIPSRRAEAAIALARLVAEGKLRLEPGAGDVATTYQALTEIAGVGDQAATMIVTRALCWPDALPGADSALQRAAGASTSRLLLARAERWRPWRAYAALHLWLGDETRRSARANATRRPSTVSAASSTTASSAASTAVPSSTKRLPCPTITPLLRVS